MYIESQYGFDEFSDNNVSGLIASCLFPCKSGMDCDLSEGSRHVGQITAHSNSHYYGVRRQFKYREGKFGDFFSEIKRSSGEKGESK